MTQLAHCFCWKRSKIDSCNLMSAAVGRNDINVNFLSLQVSTSMVCIWTAQAGTDVMPSSWSHKLKSCTPCYLSSMYTLSTMTDQRPPTYTSALSTRNQTEPTWPTYSHCCWKQARTLITGSWEVWPCSVISSKPLTLTFFRPVYSCSMFTVISNNLLLRLFTLKFYTRSLCSETWLPFIVNPSRLIFLPINLAIIEWKPTTKTHANY